jgi:hypothetical protein
MTGAIRVIDELQENSRIFRIILPLILPILTFTPVTWQSIHTHSYLDLVHLFCITPRFEVKPQAVSGAEKREKKKKKKAGAIHANINQPQRSGDKSATS